MYTEDTEYLQDINLVSEPALGYGAVSTNSQYYLINHINHGISYHSFAVLQEFAPFSVSEWSSYLHLTERTLLRYKTENKIFENIYAEKIIELSKVINKGKDTFSDISTFSKWLSAPSISLGGYKPKDLLATSIGISLVHDELVRIDYGVLA